MAEADIEVGFKVTTGEDDKPSGDLLLPMARLSLMGSATGDASGNALIDFGVPSVGRYWEITSITVVGNDDHTVVANVAVALYVGNPTVPSLAGLVLPGNQGGSAAGIPTTAQFGRWQVACMSQDHVFLRIYGGPASQAYTAILGGWDRDKDALLERVTALANIARTD